MIPTDTPPRPRFTGAEVWPTLTAAQQGEVGAAALELAIARYGADVAHEERERRAFLAAEEAAMDVVSTRGVAHVLRGGHIDRAHVPPLPALLGRVCAGCGCSEHDACWMGDMGCCSWSDGAGGIYTGEADRCTACVIRDMRGEAAP